jgi:hypothetical protein
LIESKPAARQNIEIAGQRLGLLRLIAACVRGEILHAHREAVESTREDRDLIAGS